MASRPEIPPGLISPRMAFFAHRGFLFFVLLQSVVKALSFISFRRLYCETTTTNSQGTCKDRQRASTLVKSGTHEARPNPQRAKPPSGAWPAGDSLCERSFPKGLIGFDCPLPLVLLKKLRLDWRRLSEVALATPLLS